MMNEKKINDLTEINQNRFASHPLSQDYCVTCGICSSACPVSGIDGFDPRKLVRMFRLGMEKEIVESRWPWICTMCAKCENLCPVDIDIPQIVRTVRGLRDREEVPGILHKGLEMAIQTGNNLGLPTEDYVFILEDVAEELAEEPGFEDFRVSIDKEGASLLTTIHNKLVNTHTEDLKPLWRVFHVAGEDFTIPSKNWEGTNWGFFTGDNERMKIMAWRIIENMLSLKADRLLWNE